MPRDTRPLWALPLLAFCVFLYFWGLGDVPFHTKAEPREAVVVLDEVGNGEWVLPLRNGHEIPSKPPLFHWIGGAAAKALGVVDEFTVRLPSALLATLTIFLTFWLGARIGTPISGVVAALILGTSFEFIRSATHARVDMTLTGCLTITFVALDRILSRPERPSKALLAIAYASSGLAVLAKGPVGWVLPGLAGATFLALRRDVGRFRELAPVRGFLLAVSIPLVWYLLAAAYGGPAFVEKQIIAENFGRFVDAEGSDRGHEHGFFYLVGGLFTGFAPWSLFLIPLAIELWKHRRLLADRGFLFPLVWCVTTFLFFSLSESKRTVYLLPMYPALAILLGNWWASILSHGIEMPRWSARALRIACAALSGAIFLVAVAMLTEVSGLDVLEWIRPLLHPKDQANLPVIRTLLVEELYEILFWCFALVPLLLLLLLSSLRERWGVAFSALVAFTMSTAVLVHSVFLPRIAWARTYRPFIEVVRDVVDETDQLVFYDFFDYGVVFYARRDIPIVTSTPVDGRADGSRAYVLMTKARWEGLDDEERAPLQFLHESRGTGPKGGNPLVLLLVRRMPEAGS